MEQNRAKRIVSKGRYIAAYVLKIGCYFAALTFLIKVSVFSADALSHMNLSLNEVMVFLLLFVVGFYWLFCFVLIRTCTITSRIDPGVPLTRANTANFPDPDSLVRASFEPEQEQQAVLLRAAGEGQESRTEELVRASLGGEE